MGHLSSQISIFTVQALSIGGTPIVQLGDRLTPDSKVAGSILT